MADKLYFSLVAPERTGEPEQLLALDADGRDDVHQLHPAGRDRPRLVEDDRVDAPGAEGDVGVLAGHAPFMTALREGVVVIHDGSASRTFEIQGGFADVNAQGLTILAEHAVER